MKIGLTACGNYQFYHDWFVREPGVAVIKLDAADHDFDLVKTCDGIVLTGGQDIHPRYYHQETGDIPNATAIDEVRDVFEWKLLTYIQENQVPLLGICRGLQITNVFFGGTLIADIPTIGKNNHSKIAEGNDRYHPVAVTAGTQLAGLSGMLSGTVNSAHHQAAGDIGRGLRAAAFSDDGIVEALERSDPCGMAYLLLVQWHPERMTDQQSPFSMGIKTNFLAAVAAGSLQKSVIRNP